MLVKLYTTTSKTITLMSLLSIIFCFFWYIPKAKAQINIDDTAIKITETKYSEMLNTVVMITTRRGSGSGTIIDKVETQDKGLYEYYILTNAHVTYQRFVRILENVNAITGKISTRIVDTGCWVMIFDQNNKTSQSAIATIRSEDINYDIAILSFQSENIFPVAMIADKKMLSGIRVFDEVFAIGCQLGGLASPTKGMISKITKGVNCKKTWTTYGMTSSITPGSSGGGLFKNKNEHYYLIGIPYRISLARNGQMIPHLAEAISISTAVETIVQNTSLSFNIVDDQ